MSEGQQIPHSQRTTFIGRQLGLSEIKLVNKTTGVIEYSQTRNVNDYQSVPVYVSGGIQIGVDINGIYNAINNTDPDNVGIIAHSNAVAPGVANQNIRITAGPSAAAIASNTFHGLDTRSKVYLKDGANEREINAVDTGATTHGMGVGVFDAAGDRVLIDPLGSMNTGVYSSGGSRWVISADGYGLVDPITIRAEQGNVAISSGVHAMVETSTAQNAALPDGRTARAVANQYGEIVTAGYVWAENANRTMEIDPLDQKYTGPESILAAAQNVTAAWVDLGPEIPMGGYTKLGIYVTVDINNSENFRIRALAKHTSAGAEEYVLPIRTVKASVVDIEDEYFEFVSDADELYFLEVDTNNLIPYVQFQIQAGVVGATAGQIDAAYVTRSWSPAGPKHSQKPFALDAAFDEVTESVHVTEDAPLSDQHVSSTLVDSTNMANAWYNYYIDMAGYRNCGLQFDITTTAGAIDGYVAVSLQDDGTAMASCFYTNITDIMFGIDSIRAIAGSDANAYLALDTSSPLKYIRITVGVTTSGTNNVTIYSKKQY